VHAQLAAVVDPVVHHEHAQDHRFRNGDDRFAVEHAGPVGRQPGVVQRGQDLSHRCAALFVRVENFLHRGRLLEQLGGVWQRRFIGQRETRHELRQRRDVQRQFAKRV